MSATPKTRVWDHVRSWTPLLLAVPAALVILGLLACLRAPLGDPETSRIDPALTGEWLQQDGENKNLYVVTPYDPRTYLLRLFSYRIDATGGVEAKDSSMYKVWLTKIGDQHFVTCKAIQPHALRSQEEHPRIYIVARYEREGGTIKTWGLNPQFDPVKNATTADELAAAVKANSSDPKLYGDEITLDRQGPGDVDMIKSVLEAFHTD